MVADSFLSRASEDRLDGMGSQQDGIQDKLLREGALLAAAPRAALTGFGKRMEEIKSNPAEVIPVALSGLGVGVATSLMLKNPTALFGAGRFIAQHPKLLASTFLGTDLGTRMVPAMVETWGDPNGLAGAREDLGYRLGAMPIDYAIGLPAGLAGAKIPGALSSIERTFAAAIRPASPGADKALAVRNLIGSGYEVNQQNVEMASRLHHSGDGFNGRIFAAEADLVQNGVVRNADDAHTLFSRAARCAARERGVPNDSPLYEVMSEIELRGVTPQWIQERIMHIKQSGGFDSRQMAQPSVFDVAYQAASDSASSAHRLQSIQVAERIHGSQALADEKVLQVYDKVLEAGISPKDMNLQRYYAARALQDAQQHFSVPAGGKEPTISVRLLDQIRSDTRFRSENASLRNPPQMSQSLWEDLTAGT